MASGSGSFMMGPGGDGFELPSFLREMSQSHVPGPHGDGVGVEMMDHDQGEGEGDGSFGDMSYYSVLHPKANSTFLPRQSQSQVLGQVVGVGDEFTSVNQLHSAFAMTISNMPSRLQLFEVMDEWMVHVERALNVDRHLDPDVPDDVYDKLQEILKKEYETWDLIKALYFERLNVRDDSEEDATTDASDGPIDDKFRLDDMTHAAGIVQRDKSLQEMDMIINWLELNYSRCGDPDLTPKLLAWEQTLQILKRDASLGKRTASMIKHIDPDAPYREGKELHPLDADEELRIQRGAFHYLRTGNLEKAVGFLHQSGHIAKAKALLGSVMSQKDTMQDENDGEVLSEFSVTGNPYRLLWKSTAWSICEQDMVPKWEKAVIGTCCGNRRSMLEVATTWEDQLWAYLKASVNTKVEKELTFRNRFASCDLPSEFWGQDIGIKQILETLEGSVARPYTIQHMFRRLQMFAMKNDLQTFLEEVYENIDTLFADANHPVIQDHFARFLTHALLAFAVANLGYNEQLTNLANNAYIAVMVRNGLFVGIPFYVQKLSLDLQIPVIVSQVNAEARYSLSDIRHFLHGAADSELDLLGIALAIVDKLRDDVKVFNVEMLQWISTCYDLVENQSSVLLEYLRYTVWVVRKYLTLGDIERVKSFIKAVTPECVAAAEKLVPRLLREFICYREYLEAEEALNLWKQAKGQRPAVDNLDSQFVSLADRTAFEQRRREIDSVMEKWKKSVNFHGKVAIEGFMKILTFPDGGWLHECCDPADEDEAIHINSVRRIIMKKVIFLVLNLIKENGSSNLCRSFTHALCDPRRRTLEECTSEEIESIFKVVDELTKIACPSLESLPE